MIKIKKINKEIVKPIPVKCIPNEKIKGFCLFPEIYCNIFLVARKKSGKTSAIFKILSECAGKQTKIFIFASTIYKDHNLIHIVEFLKKRGNPVETFTSLNNIAQIINTLQGESDNKNEIEKPAIKFINAESDDEDEKPKKEKKISPECIFVFDDLGTEIRNPIVNLLLKTNRHYKCKVILSSQYINDLMPEARKQIDYYLLFGGHSSEKLETIFSDADLPIKIDLFEQLYKNATKEKYSFLYIDVRDVIFRKNFDKIYELNL